MHSKLCIAAATALVALALGPAYAQTAESVDSVARGGVNSLDERVGTLEGRPTLSGLTCSSGQIAKFNGAVWVCAADDDTDTSAATECGSGEILTGDGTCVPLPSGASGQGRFQFVGDTGTALLVGGDFGKTNMDNLCHGHFPGSRMCTTEEILNTTHGNGQAFLTGKAAGWVHPSIVAVNVLAAGTAADLEATDYSGLTGHPSSVLSCDGWSSNSVDKTGLFATSGEFGQGNIIKNNCNFTSRVACCKLFP